LPFAGSHYACQDRRSATRLREETYGRGQLYINKKLVANIDMPHSVPVIFGTEGLTCGYDGGDRVASEEYGNAFTFTGVIKRVTLDLSGELFQDTAADMKITMARQ
jgi:arylsulfatase